MKTKPQSYAYQELQELAERFAAYESIYRNDRHPNEKSAAQLDAWKWATQKVKEAIARCPEARG